MLQNTKKSDTQMLKPFFFGEKYWELAKQLSKTYQEAGPYPHVVIENFLPDDVAEQLMNEVPSVNDPLWKEYKDASQLNKYESKRDENLKPFTRLFLSQLNSMSFLKFLNILSGINELISDPYFDGGGLHQTTNGGMLKIHADFKKHHHLNLDRRLNVLIYLNKDWKEEYGGHLEVWDKEMKKCCKRVLPVFNRCFIFSTAAKTYHGHPDPVTAPEGRTRKSVATYYYTAGKSGISSVDQYGTDFRQRPGESFKRRQTSKTKFLVRYAAEKVMPPIVFDFAKGVKRKIKKEKPV